MCAQTMYDTRLCVQGGRRGRVQYRSKSATQFGIAGIFQTVTINILHPQIM